LRFFGESKRRALHRVLRDPRPESQRWRSLFLALQNFSDDGEIWVEGLVAYVSADQPVDPPALPAFDYEVDLGFSGLFRGIAVFDLHFDGANLTGNVTIDGETVPF